MRATVLVVVLCSGCGPSYLDQLKDAATHAAAGDVVGAQLIYLRVLQSDAPADMKRMACTGRATILLRQGNYPGYVAAMAQAAELEPGNAALRLALADAYVLQADDLMRQVGEIDRTAPAFAPLWKKARAELDKAVQLNPSCEPEARQRRDRLP